MTQIIIGIDGGGTKTLGRAVKIDHQNTISSFDNMINHTSVLAEYVVGPCALTNDFTQSCKNLQTLLNKLSENGGFDLQNTVIVAGLSGAESSDLNQRIRDYLINALGLNEEQIVITTDARISAIGAGGNRPVVCVALGTGSVATIIDENMDFTHVGGWGFSIGDEGGAAYIGKLAVRRTLWEIDKVNTGQCREETLMSKHVKQVIGHSKDAVLAWLRKAKAYDYGQLAPVITAIMDTCPSASSVFQQHVKEVEKLINCAVTHNDVDVIITGSLGPMTIENLCPRIVLRIKEAKGGAVEGACYLAVEHHKQVARARTESLTEVKLTQENSESHDVGHDNSQQSNAALISQLDTLLSESRNPNSMEIDLLPTDAVLKIINQEDEKVPQAIQSALPQIGQAVDAIVNAFDAGGRLIYFGAGTSGRLGILDAVECPPTFSVDPEQVVALIAGGDKAIYKAVEGAEDSRELAIADLKNINLSANDVLVGIAASGRTPYVLGGLDYAKSIGVSTVSVTCNPDSPLTRAADIAICASVGPEVLTGSTRMKSGTAQKLILNMLTTAAMIQSGKCYQNLMVDVNATNKKLVARAARIVMQATQCSQEAATHALEQADYRAKHAILMINANVSADHAQVLLEKHKGRLRNAMQDTMGS